MEHPAGDRGVEHHQNHTADKAGDAVQMPFGARLFQLPVHDDGTLLGCPAHGKLHGHNGQTQNDQEEQIDQNKDCAAVFTGDVGEFPYITHADGAAGAEQNEAETASQMFALHKVTSTGKQLCPLYNQRGTLSIKGQKSVHQSSARPKYPGFTQSSVRGRYMAKGRSCPGTRKLPSRQPSAAVIP